MDYEVIHGRQGPDYGTAMRFQRGHNLHEMWQKLWENTDLGFKDAEIELTDEVEYENDRITIVGHPDGYFERYDAIYELKCVADSTYMLARRNQTPLEMHVAQGNYYANVYEAANIIFHYFNTNTGESQFFMLPADKALYQRTRLKFWERAHNKRNGVLAPRPYTDRTVAPCWWCPFVAKCYEDQEEQVKKWAESKLEISENSDLYASAVKYSETNTEKNTLSRNEKKFRKEVLDYLIDLKLRSVDIGEFVLTVSFNKAMQPVVNIDEKKIKEK